MRIATWNVNSVGARLSRLLAWLDSAKPDVLCVQELKCDDDLFPHAEISELGYEAATHASGRWNGVAVLSRVGLDDVTRGLRDEPQYEGVTQPRAIGATCGGLRVWSVYVPNGREPGHPHYAYKLSWLEALHATVTAELAAPRGAGLLVLGDFNIAPTDDDVYDINAFAGSTHVTDAERKALSLLTEAGLADIKPRALKYDLPYTYWDYRQLAFPKNRGMRIDLAFGDARAAGAVADAYVDREERKGKGGSDHAPVVLDLTL